MVRKCSAKTLQDNRAQIPLTAKQRREVAALASMPDDKIDYSDVPPIQRSLLEVRCTPSVLPTVDLALQWRTQC
jgi:hypothetical protein